MASKKEPKEASKARRKLTLNKQTLKDLTPPERQAKAVRGGGSGANSCLPTVCNAAKK